MASATIYLFQTMLAAGFGLLKLNYNFLGQHGLDSESAKALFRKTIFALRGMSVCENDLPQRLAEVLAQVWMSGRGGAEPNEDNVGGGDLDDSLRLKVRCRMSMSLVYDAVWRWRQNFQLKGKSLEGKKATFCLSSNNLLNLFSSISQESNRSGRDGQQFECLIPRSWRRQKHGATQ
jgi:hypothetical protein